MAFSPYECAWGRISPPKNVHESYINDETHRYTPPPPFFVTNRQMKKEEERKEKKIWTRVKYDAWGMQDEWENEAQTIDKNIKKC